MRDSTRTIRRNSFANENPQQCQDSPIMLPSRTRPKVRQDICIPPCREYTDLQSYQNNVRINEGLYSFTCHPHAYPQMEWAILLFIPSRRASPHLGRYSFPVPQRVWGWVGLGGWLYLPTWYARPKMVTHPSTNRPIVRRCGIELTTTASQVRCPNHYRLPSHPGWSIVVCKNGDD